MTTRREFVNSIPAWIPAAAVGGVGGGWAQERRRPVTDPLADVITQDLLIALREPPTPAALKLAATLFGRLLDATGASRRIDQFLALPDAASQAHQMMTDHVKHSEDMNKALEFAPNLPVMPMRPYTMQHAEQAVAYFRTNGFSAGLRQLIDSLRNDTDPLRLDWDCSNWGMTCLFFYGATIFVCLAANGPLCLLGLFIDTWVCGLWMSCMP